MATLTEHGNGDGVLKINMSTVFQGLLGVLLAAALFGGLRMNSTLELLVYRVGQLEAQVRDMRNEQAVEKGTPLVGRP